MEIAFYGVGQVMQRIKAEEMQSGDRQNWVREMLEAALRLFDGESRLHGLFLLCRNDGAGKPVVMWGLPQLVA